MRKITIIALSLLISFVASAQWDYARSNGNMDTILYMKYDKDRHEFDTFMISYVVKRSEERVVYNWDVNLITKRPHPLIRLDSGFTWVAPGKKKVIKKKK